MTGDKQQQGFTLVEMIMAVSMFAIVSVVIAQLFTTFSRAQQRAGINQKIQSDARVMMAQISDRIRTGSIDYAAYGTGIAEPENQLFLIDENGLHVVIRKSDTDFANTSCPSVKSTPCLEISEDGGTTFFPMSTENFTVESVQFFVQPSTDPFAPSGPNVQPIVTFSISLQNSSTGASLQPVYVQTSVASRVYQR